MTAVLFVCTGNIFRSALAEGIARKLAGPDSGLDFSSAGTHAQPGARSPAPIVRAAGEIDLALRWHRAQLVDEDLLAAADLVYALDHTHLEFLRSRFPEHAGKVDLLDPSGVDVADAMGWDAGLFRHGRDHIARAIAARMGDWVSRPS